MSAMADYTDKRLDVSILVVPGDSSATPAVPRHVSESATRERNVRLPRDYDMIDVPTEAYPAKHDVERISIDSSDKGGAIQRHKDISGDQRPDLFESRGPRSDTRRTTHDSRGGTRAPRDIPRSYRH